MDRILVVEDISETRRWLEEVSLKAFPGSKIEGVPNVASGLRQIELQSYDLALIDLGLPDGTGLDVLKVLRRKQPEAQCVITTVLGEDSHVVAALSAGAHGYILKEQPADQIINQLKQLAAGIPALSPSIARRIMEHFQRTGPSVQEDENLTPKEKDVLALIGRGLRNSEAAQDLGISENTIASHIKSIYRKLGISSRAEAAWHATRLGFATRNQEDH
ncbi:response regulator [Yoonia sp. R2331]|uniref:response regulator n=1 Tax=Yoonia sp. R2331 TaxID=3237238 RepID=UPI0034E59B22